MKFNNVHNCIWINNRYYIIKNMNTVEIYDNNFEFIEEFKTEVKYSSITYNDKEKLFYFSLANNNKLLHKSNDFETFEAIELNLPAKCFEEIKHISYCQYLNSILITTIKKVLIFNLTNYHIKVLFQVKENINQINDCMRPLGWDINCDMVLTASICCCKEILVAYRIGKLSFIAKLIKGELNEIVYKTDNFINSMFIVRKKLWILVTKQCHKELINTEIECDCSCSKDCNCQIVESIASIEKSIAKILDSESLKIKAAIDKSQGVNDLICINSSVKEVIYYVTILEFILTEKLKTAKSEETKDCDCNNSDFIC